MKSKIEILTALPYFTGTVEYHAHQFINVKLNLTDGTAFIREACGAYWLFDIIAQQSVKRTEFIIQLRQLNSGSWIFKTTDFWISLITINSKQSKQI